MQHWHAAPRRPLCHRLRRHSIDAGGKVRLVFGAVDASISGGIDDQVRGELIERSTKRLRLRQVELRAPRRDDRAVPTQLQSQRRADLPAGAGE